MYFDTSYIAKFYLNEPESGRVRGLVEQKRDSICSSAWAVAEFHAVLHRRVREGSYTPADAREFALRFSAQIENGLWKLVPVSERVLRRAGALILAAPRDLFLRAGDAVHLTTAQEAGEVEVWTNDRHMLAAAAYFGVTGRSV